MQRKKPCLLKVNSEGNDIDIEFLAGIIYVNKLSVNYIQAAEGYKRVFVTSSNLHISQMAAYMDRDINDTIARKTWNKKPTLDGDCDSLTRVTDIHTCSTYTLNVWFTRDGRSMAN